MCGRNSLFHPPDELEARFEAELVADGGYTPQYNIAPGDEVGIITSDTPDEIQFLDWGLIPPWADSPDTAFINARAETAPDKPAFEDAWESRPCLVLSSGFYDWQEGSSGTKQPYRIYPEDESPFAMAGLWSRWEGPNTTRRCVTVLTTEPNELMEPIHHRMPVILRDDEESTWLSAGAEQRRELCRPYPDDDFVATEISTRINDPTNDDPSVIDELDHEQSGLGDFG
jgi:putative SOS response-associated peptidase YedK